MMVFHSAFPYSELPDPTLIIDPITEERASRTLYRIELLRRIREQVLPHPLLSERLKLCQPSQDLPEWWDCGRHDKDLLLGASKHGVSRTDYHILNDTTLAFLGAHQRFTNQRGTGVSAGAQGELTKSGVGAVDIAPAPLLTPTELASAAAAAKIAINTAKKEEGEGKEMKTEEGKEEMEVKTEAEGGDENDILCAKTETPDEQKENEGEVGEGKEKAPASPVKDVKKEETLPKAVKVEEEELKESGEGEKSSSDDQDKELIEEKASLTPVTVAGDQETTTEVPEHREPQASHKAAEEEDGEPNCESPKSPKSPKSLDTEKSPEDEEEERMDEDDKSDKSSQAEGRAGLLL